MSKIEPDAYALNLIIDNLTNFSCKADRLLAGKSISYPDFFDQYREFLRYLKTLDFGTDEIKELIEKVPKIPASGFSLMKLLMLLPFFLYLFIIQIYFYYSYGCLFYCRLVYIFLLKEKENIK